MATPTLEEVIREAINAGLARVHVGMPGRVVSYDHTTQNATVQPIPEGAYEGDDEDVERYIFEPIANVPVQFESATGYAITFPLTVGDHGWISFGERSIDEWLATGADSTRPTDLRRHDLTDAVFYPGTRSFAKAIAATGYDVSGMVIEGASIKLGSSAATSAVALANEVAADLASLKAAIAAVVPVPGDGGATIQAAFAAWTPTGAGATKVKAE